MLYTFAKRTALICASLIICLFVLALSPAISSSQLSEHSQAFAAADTITVTDRITAQVTGNGNVIVPPTYVTNNHEQPITLTQILPPTGFQWTNDGYGKTIKPGQTLAIQWTAKGNIPENIIQRLTQNASKTPVPAGYISYSYELPKPKAFAVYSNDDNSLNFYKRTNIPQEGEQFEGKTATKVYKSNDFSDDISAGWGTLKGSIVKIAVIDEGITPCNISSWFYGCGAAKTIDVKKLDTSRVTNMRNAFGGCKALTSLDLNTWDVSQVTNISRMFLQCINLKSLSVSKWDTKNITTMDSTFEWCHKLTNFDISRWDTSKTTNMMRLFLYCTELTTLNIRNWNTSNVTNMDALFMGCYELSSLDLSQWDTKNVTSMEETFRGCNRLKELNLSGWDTSNVTSMAHLFYDMRYPANTLYEVRLQKLTLGKGWKWVGTNGFLYPSQKRFFPTADEKWYDHTGKGYTPETIPSNRAATYYPAKNLVPK